MPDKLRARESRVGCLRSWGSGPLCGRSPEQRGCCGSPCALGAPERQPQASAQMCLRACGKLRDCLSTALQSSNRVFESLGAH
jgi:hypothetical protein